jgi:hypothetical protein
MSSQRENVVMDMGKYMEEYKVKPTRTLIDPLDQALIEEDSMLARDVKRTHLKRIQAEETKRLKELESELDGGEEKTTKATEEPGVDPRVYQMIISLPEEERQKALDVYTAMVAAKGARGEALYMPLILSSMKAQPTANTGDLVLTVTKIVDLLQSAKAPPPSSDAATMADAMVKVASINKGGNMGEMAGLITAIAEVMKPSQPQGPAADPVATAIGMIRDLKDLGLMGNQQPIQTGTSDETKIRLEEIRRDTDIKLAELGLKKDTEMRKLDNDEKRTNAIGGLIERAAKVAGRAFAEGEGSAGEQPAAQAAPAAEVGSATCPGCGREVGVPEPKVARTIACPFCNKNWQWAGKA